MLPPAASRHVKEYHTGSHAAGREAAARAMCSKQKDVSKGCGVARADAKCKPSSPKSAPLQDNRLRSAYRAGQFIELVTPCDLCVCYSKDNSLAERPRHPSDGIESNRYILRIEQAIQL
jgi:hypothetical protein